MSFNVSPQPRFWPPPFPSSPLTPIVPRISNPAIRNNLNFLTQNYWEGAVRINAGNELVGEAVGRNFSNFVCSFWAANLMPFDDGSGNFGGFMPCFASDGPFTFFQPGNSPHLSFGNFCILLTQSGQPFLLLLNANNSSLIWSYAGPGNIMGWDNNDNPILPLGAWHHYIFSYSSSIPRSQIIVDRGNIFDTTLGPTRAAFNNPTNLDWKIVAPEEVLIDFAYFYFGTSDNFFDLSIPTNLDYFISSSLNPVNFGPAGSYVAPAESNINPLTCLIMHTGNAANLFGVPTADPWVANAPYGPLPGIMVSYNGKIYYNIVVGINIGNRPDISPGQWALLIPTTGFQFPYNAATGLLWGGTVSTAPTAPPIGV